MQISLNFNEAGEGVHAIGGGGRLCKFTQMRAWLRNSMAVILHVFYCVYIHLYTGENDLSLVSSLSYDFVICAIFSSVIDVTILLTIACGYILHSLRPVLGVSCSQLTLLCSNFGFCSFMSFSSRDPSSLMIARPPTHSKFSSFTFYCLTMIHSRSSDR